jgi:hypothetical protein
MKKNDKDKITEPTKEELNQTKKMLKDKYDLVVPKSDLIRLINLIKELEPWLRSDKASTSPTKISEEMAIEFKDSLKSARGVDISVTEAYEEARGLFVITAYKENWAHQATTPGYRLFDFSGRFGCITWRRQEDEIAKLGGNYERAEEQAVTEACFSVSIISGGKERLLRHWYHWGRMQAASGRHVYVGGFHPAGWRVNSKSGGCHSSDMRAVLSIKPNQS